MGTALFHRHVSLATGSGSMLKRERVRVRAACGREEGDAAEVHGESGRNRGGAYAPVETASRTAPRNRMDRRGAGALAPELGMGRVLNIFATLARHPKLLKRWLVFGDHVLGKSTLSAREREIAILRVGWLCRCEYEWGQHVVIGRMVGLSERDPTDPHGAFRARMGYLRGDPVDGRRRAARRFDDPRRDLERPGGSLRHPAAHRPRLHRRPVHARVDGAQHPGRATRRRHRGLPQ